MNEKLVETVLIEYQKEFDRKNSLDSKTIGYITFVSLIISASIGLFAITTTVKPCIECLKYLSLVILFIELYFSSFAIIFAFRSHRMRELANLDLSEVIALWTKDDNYIHGSIIRTVEMVLKHNREINKEIEKDNDLVYSLVRITIFVFILLSLISILIFFGGIYGR